jgi:uncharacterized membrane-anchored protein YhcB (DUF1043 family)
MNPWIAAVIGAVAGGSVGAVVMAMLAGGARDDQASGRARR